MFPQHLRRLALLLLTAAGLVPLAHCSKARGDEFSRFKPSFKLSRAGDTPRSTLRYAPPLKQAIPYQLAVTRRVPAYHAEHKATLSVELIFPSRSAAGGPILVRYAAGATGQPNLPAVPGKILVRAVLGPTGALGDLYGEEAAPSGANLPLLMPLLIPRLPAKPVGKGASWKASFRHGWASDAMVDHQYRLRAKSKMDVIFRASYSLAQLDSTRPDGAELAGIVAIRLRGKTKTMARETSHRGQGKAQVSYRFDARTGLPEKSSVAVSMQHEIKANDKTKKATETLELTLTRQR